MNEKTIEIHIEDIGDVEGILSKVYRLTANAALQRGDAVNVATEDSSDMLKQFLAEGFKLMEKAFGRYYVGDKKYSMPQNWPDLKTCVDEQVEIGLVNYILAKWFELSGKSKGDIYMVLFTETLNNIKELLSKRKKTN